MAPADSIKRTEASPPDFAAAWQITPDALRLTLPTKTRAAYEIIRTAPLPEGDWTLDFGLVQHNESVSVETLFFIGAPQEVSFQIRLDPGLDNTEVRAELHRSGKREEYSSKKVNGAAGPIQWVRLIHKAGNLELFVNGIAVPLKAFKDGASLPRVPLGFRFYSSSPLDKSVSMEVAAFQVRPGAWREQDSVPGIAFQGWPAGAPLKWSPAQREKFDTRLQAILAAPDADAITRANAMAAQVLAARATTGALPDATWQQFADFLTKATDLDLDALSRLLPIAIASADVAAQPARRAKADVWTQRLFEALPSPSENRADVMPILQRLALLDPARTATAASRWRVSLPFARALATDLREAAPLKGFAALRTFERAFPDAEAWLLPETNTLSPLWGALVTRRLQAFAGEKSFYSGQPDRVLAAAAYRLASTQPATALEFAKGIQKPEAKAEALEAMAGVLPADAGRELDAGIESALRAAIAVWQPTSRDDSVVPQNVRLAQWLWKRGRTDEARQVLDAAMTQIGKLPQTRFRDTWAIARALRDMQAPNAKVWLEKAATAAAERDANADEFGPGVYLSATTLVVGELVKSGQIEEAFALTQRLDRDALGTNYDLALARIIFALSKDDMHRDLPRALRLSEELSPGNQRDIVRAHLAGVFSATDMTTALRLFEELPEARRIGAAFGMLKTAPPLQAEKLRALVGEAIASHLREWKTVKRHDTHERLLTNLGQLSVAALLDLEPAFQDDRAFFVAQLLAAITREAGWQSTPLWKRYASADSTGGWSTPWGLGHLRDSIRAEESNREKGLE